MKNYSLVKQFIIMLLYGILCVIVGYAVDSGAVFFILFTVGIGAYIITNMLTQKDRTIERIQNINAGLTSDVANTLGKLYEANKTIASLKTAVCSREQGIDVLTNTVTEKQKELDTANEEADEFATGVILAVKKLMEEKRKVFDQSKLITELRGIVAQRDTTIVELLAKVRSNTPMGVVVGMKSTTRRGRVSSEQCCGGCNHYFPLVGSRKAGHGKCLHVHNIKEPHRWSSKGTTCTFYVPTPKSK